MPELQPVRGTRDLIGEDQRRYAHVVNTARRVTSLYGFDEWQTPIFEDTAVFSRTLGDTSDVVTKEMYTFQDRGGDSVTLRPEGTAGVCRALVSNGLTQSLPQKVFYAGPMFRYERPQKGRYRQFHQIGAELIGPAEPLADAEVIAMGWHILQELGVSDKVRLQLNTLGDAESRQAHRMALINYLQDRQSDLSDESLVRLAKNPLRILDSKSDMDQKVLVSAPVITEYLSTGAAAFYDRLKHQLNVLGVTYDENPKIVRGLDYYNHTAFEFVTSALGAQGTVLAGGRYDGLVSQMGGPQIPAVGWAAGIERLSMLVTGELVSPIKIALILDEETQESRALAILQTLRKLGRVAEISYRGNVFKRLDLAKRMNAQIAVFVLVKDQEIQPNRLIVRDFREVSESGKPGVDFDLPMGERLIELLLNHVDGVESLKRSR